MKGRAVRKLLLSVLTAVMIVLIRPVPVQADWIQDKFGWWFQYSIEKCKRNCYTCKKQQGWFSWNFEFWP